jgi:drug/metabolite transporter (DMT)-like permease
VIWPPNRNGLYFVGNFPGGRLTPRVSDKKHDSFITANLLLVVLLWGGNNAGTKWLLVNGWMPIWTGGSRFLIAGMILLGVLRLTNWFGKFPALTNKQHRQLWLRGGLTLAAYVVVFCWALKLTAAAHVALYIGASPIWSLLIEERPQKNWSSVRRYAAASLALAGVLVLFWPALKTSGFNLAGEICGLLASFTWAIFNLQSRVLAREMSGLEVAANSMWMSGVLLLPLVLFEIFPHGVVLDAPHVGIQSLNILFGSVVAYALWNTALRHWQTSRVMLFNNLIPLSTATWAHFCLGEPITSTFCTAMILIVAGVLLGQVDWSKIFKLPEGF